MSEEQKAKIRATRAANFRLPDSKRCSDCGEVQPQENFGRRKEGRLLRSRCRECDRRRSREYFDTRPETLRENNRRGAFARRGITEAEYDRLFAEQGGVCAICGTPETRPGRRLYVDHDHDCCQGNRSCGSCNRGLLCTRCNMGIGYFNDDPGRLASAVEYIRSHRVV